MAGLLSAVFALTLPGAIFESSQIGSSGDFPGCDGYMIRYYAGLGPLDENYNYAGNIPSITLFGETGVSLGRAKNKGTIGEGNHLDFCVEGLGSNQRAGYVALSASDKDDAICLSAIVVTHPDGHVNTVTGDMPASCDYANGYSYTSVGDAMPKCMWLDGDYTRGTENGDGFMQGLSFHLKDFEPTEERIKYYNLLPDTLCNSEPRMHQRHKFDSKAHIRVFDPPLKYIEGKLEEDYEHLWDTTLWGWSEEVWKRSALPFAKRAAEHLSTLTLYVSRLFTRAPAATSIYDRSEGTVIRSNHTSQSAVTLCDTPSMFGPDFVSLQEQIFCDMRTREKYPVCQPENSEARGTCFDL